MNWVNDVKVGWATVVATVGPAVTGMWAALPTVISLAGGVLGLVLTCVLIRVQLANGAKARLELKILRAKDAERQREEERRRREGLPNRRSTDPL